MTIAFEIEYPDFLAFQQYYASSDSSFRRSRIIITWIVPLTTIALALILRGLEWNSMIFALLASTLWVALSGRLFRYSVANTARKLYKNPANAKLFARREMTFSERGVNVKTDSAESSIAWSDVAKVAETEGYFFVFTGSNQGYVIPKRRIGAETAKKLAEMFEAHNLLSDTGKK